MSDISGFNLGDFFSSARSLSPHLAVQTLSSQLLFEERLKTPQSSVGLISIDGGFGFIRRYVVTDAAVHDSQVLAALLDIDNPDGRIWADSAYRSEARLEVLEWMGFDPLFNERAYRNSPLSDEQKATNRERSKTRAKVAHVFGSWVSDSGSKLLRPIGIARAKTNLGLQNLVYNFKRLVFLKSQATSAEITG